MEATPSSPVAMRRMYHLQVSISSSTPLAMRGFTGIMIVDHYIAEIATA
jgi:hypothetical protein